MLVKHTVARRARVSSVLSSVLMTMLLVVLTPEFVRAATPTIDFNRDIRPIFSDHCYACHGPDQNKRKAGLRLDTKDGALKELDSGGFAIVPGQPKQSALLKVISLPPDDDDHMPPAKSKQLNAAQIDLLRRWITQGAKWAEHWAYVAPVRPVVPTQFKVQNPIDAFVLAKLKENKLKPNKEAERPALIRRASLDLTGLPPSIAEVDAFLADKNPDAYEKIVDRLMASPHFGERMALAWLDQARYADTAGYHFDGFRQMHHWRDWVIKSFNDNKPFDQFTIEQIAGDLLPNATIDQKIATGFHRNVMTTDEGGVDPEEYLTKYQVDRVSTTAQVWLGSTLGCAECHDHKYDPLTQKEFYQFYAFFNSIPEKGLDGTRTNNPAPVLRLPSVEQGSKLLRYLDLIAAAEKTQADREGELPKAQEKWEKELGEVKAPEIAGMLKEFSFEEKDLSLATSTTNEFVVGKIGRALKLSGATNDFVDAGQAVSFEFTNAFSYGAWIKLHDKTGTVLSKMAAGPGYRGFDLLISNGKIEVHLASEFPDNAIKVVGKEALPTNEWRHVFVTYDGLKKAAGVKLYIGGRSQSLDVSKDKLSATITTDTPLFIGTRLKAFPFRGLIDDVRFYNRALRSNEVAALSDYPSLSLAKLPKEQRTKEQRDELKTFFRENHATDFLAARARLAQLQKEKKELLAEIPDTMVMDELEKPRDTFMLVRGNYQNKGEKVTPGTPAAWPPLPTGQPTNRLALARWLVATTNPLTARVTVNRLWSMLFGTGLVKTANDFGSQGERPSHPELLDWLACEFSANWDIKHVVRLIVTSASYRQSAVVSKDKLERDPYSRLISRGPRLRLDAELIRDNALAASGLLNAKIGGPSIKPYQPPNIWDITDHKYKQSTGEDLYRRGLYVFWKRAAHYPSFQTFDAPSREICTLQRQRTSTPLQSLVVMNDPVYVEAARVLAARVLQEGGDRLRDQVTLAFRLTLARPPRAEEIKVLEKTFHEQRTRFLADTNAAMSLLSIGESPRPKDLPPADHAAMTGVANVLLNLNETMTK
jgi:mono/diheme cytochrome c family protein